MKKLSLKNLKARDEIWRAITSTMASNKLSEWAIREYEIKTGKPGYYGELRRSNQRREQAA